MSAVVIQAVLMAKSAEGRLLRPVSFSSQMRLFASAASSADRLQVGQRRHRPGQMNTWKQ
jgi:hypothetical protein